MTSSDAAGIRSPDEGAGIHAVIIWADVARMPILKSLEGSRWDESGRDLLGEQLAIDRVLSDLHPVARAVLAEDLDTRVDELLVLQHLQARLLTGISAVGAQDQLVAFRTRRQPVWPNAAHEVRVPLLGFADAPEDGVDLHAGDWFG